MATNVPIILLAAVCKLHDRENDTHHRKHHHHKPAGHHGHDGDEEDQNRAVVNLNQQHSNQGLEQDLRQLRVIAAHRLADAPAPTIEDALRLIERVADLRHSHADRIVLDNHVLYYSVYATPQGNTIYLCIANAPVSASDAADATAHAAAAAQFLGLLQYAVNSDAELTHAISLPNLRDAGQPDPEQDRIRPRFIDLVTNAHRNAMDYAHNNIQPQQPQSSSSAAPIPSARIAELQRQVEDVKTVMSDNVVRIMERGERLENLDSRTEALHASSQNFKTTARRVQRNMCLKNLKWTIVLAVFSVLLVAFIVYATLRELGVVGGGK